MIAAALVLEPVLLIADEPTTALDVTTQAQILKLMRELQQRKGMALLFITHDFGVVAEIADQVTVMRFGRVVESGTAQEVLRAPQHPYTRALIDAIPHGRARQSGAFVNAPLLEVKALCKSFHTSGGLLRRGREVHAARQLSFTLSRGETLGIVGESGSGKSTLGRLLTGLVRSDSGQVQFDDHTLAPELRQLGITDYFVILDGPNRFAISLGVYSSEKGGQERLAEVKEKGVRSALPISSCTGRPALALIFSTTG